MSEAEIRAALANIQAAEEDIVMAQAGPRPIAAPAGNLQPYTPAQVRVLMQQLGIKEGKVRKVKAPGQFAGRPEALKEFRRAQAAAAREKRKQTKLAGGGKLSAATKLARVKSGKRVGSNPNTVSNLKALAHANGMRISKPAITQLYTMNLNGQVLKIAMQLARSKKRMTVKPEDVVLAVYTLQGQGRS